MSDTEGKPLLPRWRPQQGEHPSAVDLDRVRSMETVIADLARQLAALPAGHPRRSGLIGMIRGLSAEITSRERLKVLSPPHPAPSPGRKPPHR
jgi:hypothetical protein